MTIWFSNENEMDTTTILKIGLELKFKRKRPMGQPVTDGLERYWKISARKGRSGKELKNNDCGKKEQTEDFSSTEPRTTELETIYSSGNNG
jgi:hypothetical protein